MLVIASAAKQSSAFAIYRLLLRLPTESRPENKATSLDCFVAELLAMTRFQVCGQLRHNEGRAQ